MNIVQRINTNNNKGVIIGINSGIVNNKGTNQSVIVDVNEGVINGVDSSEDFHTFVREFEITDEIKAVAVTSFSSDIYIRKGKTLKVRYTGRFKGKYAPSVIKHVIMNALSVTVDTTLENTFLQFSAIEVTIPRDVEGVLIESTIGNIKIEDNLSIDKINVKNTFGQVDIISSSKEIDVKTKKGGISVESNASEITTQTVKGDIEITCLSTEDTKVSCESSDGNIDIYTAIDRVKYKNIQCNAKTSSGTIENKTQMASEGPTLTLNLSTTNGDIYID